MQCNKCGCDWNNKKHDQCPFCKFGIELLDTILATSDTAIPSVMAVMHNNIMADKEFIDELPSNIEEMEQDLINKG